MSNLKSLRLRIKSVKSTQKITKAMQMVAASKLKKAVDSLNSSEYYIEQTNKILAGLLKNNEGNNFNISLLNNDIAKIPCHLVVIITSGRGLCGAFNSSIIKFFKKFLYDLKHQGKDVKILCIGKKGYESLKNLYKKDIMEVIQWLNSKESIYYDAESITQDIIKFFEEGLFNECTLIYNKFKSVISQTVISEKLIPITCHEYSENVALYEYDTCIEDALKYIIPLSITTKIYKALLLSNASEQGSRMTAMDNASRNAAEMIKHLTLVYNGIRQDNITKELIEIISGAEAI